MKNVSRQYRDSTNLKTRASLHAKFSTNEVDWVRWVFERLGLQPGSRVLELGCGTGQLWRRNRQDLPPGCEVVLLEVTEAGPVVAYAQSTDRYDMSGGRASRLAELVEDEIARNGRFLVAKETGLFEARK